VEAEPFNEWVVVVSRKFQKKVMSKTFSELVLEEVHGSIRNHFADNYDERRYGVLSRRDLAKARVKATMLPSVMRLKQVDFIKMDIEGAEPHALRGSITATR